MSLLDWIDRTILSRRRPHVREALRASDDLLTTKRSMARFSDDLEAGRIQGQHKVIHIPEKSLEPPSRDFSEVYDAPPIWRPRKDGD